MRRSTGGQEGARGQGQPALWRDTGSVANVPWIPELVKATPGTSSFAADHASPHHTACSSGALDTLGSAVGLCKHQSNHTRPHGQSTGFYRLEHSTCVHLRACASTAGLVQQSHSWTALLPCANTRVAGLCGWTPTFHAGLAEGHTTLPQGVAAAVFQVRAQGAAVGTRAGGLPLPLLGHIPVDSHCWALRCCALSASHTWG